MADFAFNDLIMFRHTGSVTLMRNERIIYSFFEGMGQMLGRSDTSMDAFDLQIRAPEGDPVFAIWRSTSRGAGHLFWTVGDAAAIHAITIVLFALDPVADGVAISSVEERFGVRLPQETLDDIRRTSRPTVFNVYFTEQSITTLPVTAGQSALRRHITRSCGLTGAAAQ